MVINRKYHSEIIVRKMAPGTTIAPLSNSQKLFLQRLLVAHALTDEDAKQLYESIKEGFAGVTPSQTDDDDDDDEEGEQPQPIDHGYMGNSFEHCLGIINASLVPGFQLEIATVSLPPPYNNDDENEDQPQLLSPGRRKRATFVKYHAIVNRSNDGFARSYAFPPVKGGGPHEMAYFRLVLEKIVERGLEQVEGGAAAAAAAVGCPGALNRMELINLKLEMEGAHKDKLSIRQTERALEMLEEQKWLVQVAPPAEEDSDADSDQQEEEEEEEEGDNGDNGDNEKEERRRPQRKRKKRPSSRGSASGGSRRKSLKGTFYGIGPRSFMELGEFLQSAGLPGDRMPQSILHRV